MSDCSTNAMKPKEPPRMCGTCMNGEPAVSCLTLGKYRRFTNTSENRKHGCWKPRTNEWGLTEQDVAIIKLGAENSDLKQRCQQFEQVAREMLAYIGSVTFLLDNKFQSRDDARENAKAFIDFDDRLKALGVSVDD